MTLDLDPKKIPAERLFLTPEFTESGWIKDLCRSVGEVWTAADVMPPGHFGTYFGATARRTYKNPYISDLYWLHELTHVRTLKYSADPKRSWLDWSRGMIGSELEASLTSECYVYLHIPGLREKTFPHEIWFDRFRDVRVTVWSDEVTDMKRHIRQERLRALSAPKFDDFLERQIRNYYDQNHKWCRIWTGSTDLATHGDTPAFRIVEEHMSSPDRDGTHVDWLASLATEISPLDPRADAYLAPFMRQALDFKALYDASNAEYGNAILMR